MTEEEYRMDILEQEKLEERARKFVDLNQSQMDQPMQAEVQSSAQTQLENDMLDTLKRLRETSLTSGDHIDAQLRKVFVGGLPHNLSHN